MQVNEENWLSNTSVFPFIINLTFKDNIIFIDGEVKRLQIDKHNTYFIK